MLSISVSEIETSHKMRNVFDLRKLHHLVMVQNNRLLLPEKQYWMVYSPRGVILSNWKTKVKVLELVELEFRQLFVRVECSIMDNNFTFVQLHDAEEYTFFEYTHDYE
jgi:hypothetical protein